MTYRLMVVGSPDWEDDEVVHRELSKSHDLLNGMPITLVTVGVGGHGKGAEAMASDVAQSLGWEIEIYPPDYGAFGVSPYISAASELVDTHPDICLAFLTSDNGTAAQAASMAETVGIQTLRFDENQW